MPAHVGECCLHHTQSAACITHRVLPASHTECCLHHTQQDSKTQSSPVIIDAHELLVLRPICPQLPGSDGPQELHHGLVHVQLVQKHQHVVPGVARPADALQHVLYQNSAQIGSPARVARRLVETSLTTS